MIFVTFRIFLYYCYFLFALFFVLSAELPLFLYLGCKVFLEVEASEHEFIFAVVIYDQCSNNKI